MASSVQDTILGKDGWTSAPLYQGLFFNQTSYVGSNQSNGLLIGIYPNNSASLTFPVNDSNIAFTFYLAQSVFSPHNFQIPVACVHPLSGQYDALTRGLFYLLLIFSLVFRRHTWLSTAALGTAMTYAATTAVHAFALVTRFGFGTPLEPSTFDSDNGDWLPNGWNANSSKEFGDIDIYGIYPVLAAAAIMLTPILNWSVTIRKHEAQAAVIYWGCLVFAALVPAWIRYNNLDIYWWLNTPLSFVLCPYANDPANLHCGPDMVLTTHLYNHCQCIDFCGAISPSAPMRKNANMVPYIGRPVWVNEANDSQPLARLATFNYFILAFIVVQGMFGLIESQFTQAEVRNYVFRALYAEPRDFIMLFFEGKREQQFLKKFGMEDASPKTTFRWKCQFQLARFIAAAFYVTAIIFAIVCPVVLVTTIITTELYLTAIPVSELSDAVGAWGAWTGAAFVLIGAVISEYHKSWMRSVRVVLTRLWRVVQFAKGEPQRQIHVQGYRPETVGDRVNAFFLEISIPLVHAWYSTLRAFWTLRYTQHTFIQWFKDPKHVSKQTRRQAQEQADHYREHRCPKCQCEQCKRDRKNGLDEKKVLGERKGSTFGETLAKGVEKRYTVKRAARGDREPGEDFGLPPVPVTSSLSLPMVKIDAPSPSAQAQTQQRQTFARKNTDTTQEFSIPRKAVQTGSAPELVEAAATPGLEREEETLLLGQSGTEPVFTNSSYPVAEPVEDQGAVEALPITAGRLSSSGYDRLHSR